MELSEKIFKTLDRIDAKLDKKTAEFDILIQQRDELLERNRKLEELVRAAYCLRFQEFWSSDKAVEIFEQLKAEIAEHEAEEKKT